MRTIEKYLLTDDEVSALRSTFVPLAFLMGDEEKARMQVNRLTGNMVEYTREQRDELIEAVREVCNEARRQSRVEHWGDMPHAEGLAHMRYNESVRLATLVAMLTIDVRAGVYA